MDLITWDDSLTTGIMLIDAQHKTLVNKANKLSHCIQDNNSCSDLSILLDELLEYTFYHFETEEEYFDKYNYLDKENHLKEHNDFRDYIKSFLFIKDKANILEALTLLSYLRDWITHHIKEVDMKYVSFLKECIEKQVL